MFATVRRSLLLKAIPRPRLVRKWPASRIQQGVRPIASLFRPPMVFYSTDNKDKTREGPYYGRLPEDGISLVKWGTCHIYLVGVTHGKEESRERVREMIDKVKPEIVFLELDNDRERLLRNKESEFCVANEEAQKYNGRIMLGDMPTKELQQLVYSKISESDMEDVMHVSSTEKSDPWELVLRLVNYGFFPEVIETFVCKRNEYMAAKLKEAATNVSSIVAVVGRDHLVGLKKRIESD